MNNRTPRKSTATATPDASDLRAALQRAEAALKRAEARRDAAMAAYAPLAEAHRLAAEAARAVENGNPYADLIANAKPEAKAAAGKLRVAIAARAFGDRAVSRAAGSVKRARAAFARAEAACVAATEAEARAAKVAAIHAAEAEADAAAAGTGSAAQDAANRAWNAAAAAEAVAHAAAAARDRAARKARPGRVASVALAVFAFAVPVTLAAYALTPEPHRALAGALCGCLVGPALGIFLAARRNA